MDRLTSCNRRYETYERMACDSSRVHWAFNLAAISFSWILLAGFIILPGKVEPIDKLLAKTQASRDAHDLALKIPFIAVASVCCTVGSGGILWLWFRFRFNYDWLLTHLFR